jgi:RNA polymerase sigma-70 factor, ECF subfamily
MVAQDAGGNDSQTEEFLRLLDQHEGALRGYILSQVVSWSDADDIAQETRLRLWRQFSQYDRSKDFGAWARTIAHFMVLAHRKESERRSGRYSEQFVTLMEEAFDRVATENSPRREALSGCLEKLPEFQRSLLLECYGPQATIKEVAARVGRSIRGLQQTVARLRLILQKCVDRNLGSMEGETLGGENE